MTETFSGTRFAGQYLIAQSLAICAWWLWLFLHPDSQHLFLPTGASPTDLLAFRLPDLAIAAPVSMASGVAFLIGSRWSTPFAWATAGAIDYAFAYCVGWSVSRGGGWLNVALMAPAALLSTVAALDTSHGTISLFRRASLSTPARHVVATLGQIALFWSFFLLVVPVGVTFVETRLAWPQLRFSSQVEMAGLLLLLFSALGLASGITMASRGFGTPLPFAAPNRLVTTGPYAYIRNPMVVAGLGQGVAVALWFGSWALIAYVLLGGLIWQYLVRPAEQRDLRRLFGDDFLSYQQQVRCWIPRLRPFNAGAV